MLSCQSKQHQDPCGSAWIGGQIVNPKHDYVIISHNRNTIDTVYLDERNSFTYKIAPVDPGLYFFRHFEYQALFIEPGDSVMLRVNTIEFDESLTYTGKGSAKNNFLTELFLLNETVDQSLVNYYALTPEVFQATIDSIKRERLMFLDQFVATQDVSESFLSMANAAIDYAIFSKNELYLSANYRKQQYDESVVIPETFYNYRAQIDLGHDHLWTYYPYFRCIGYYLDNLAYLNYRTTEDFDRRSFTHTWHKIDLIDQMTTNDSLKHSLLKNTVASYFMYANKVDEEERMLIKFKALNHNKDDHKLMEELAESIMKLAPGKIIPDVVLVNTDNEIVSLKHVIKRPSVFYFWSLNSSLHYKKIHNRVNELAIKYPEYDFIGINVDDQFKKWQRLVKHLKYNAASEYQFDNFGQAEMTWLVNSVNRSMIISQERIIVNANINIFGIKVEQELLNYLNQ
jgi:peroxiredoxin